MFAYFYPIIKTATIMSDSIEDQIFELEQELDTLDCADFQSISDCESYESSLRSRISNLSYELTDR